MKSKRRCGMEGINPVPGPKAVRQSRKTDAVVLVGVGKLGKALMSYAGYSVYDLDILAGFDVDPKIIKKGAYGKPVYPIDRLNEICRRLDAKIGVITTPGSCAQPVCDALVKAGIVAVWNYSSVRLKAPPQVMVHHEDMTGSLRRLAEYAAKH
ncbi:redox-sensing transcriptional repressor Rex [Caproiciproducens sp. R1]|uniref:redox-sensing transcriptional repressor Rex n=1 Tax=Caproiciproducens sp. R1 TaxID=3435000 RepID=UPI0040333022